MRRESKEKSSEKRGDHRHTLALDTEVHFNEQSVANMFRCRTKNIGLQGAFLPSKSMPINSNTNVEVVFRASAPSILKQYRLQAQVVHTSDDGAGLVFSPLDREEQKQFRQFLFRAKVAARHELN